MLSYYKIFRRNNMAKIKPFMGVRPAADKI
jgi:hypothetical protein